MNLILLLTVCFGCATFSLVSGGVFEDFAGISKRCLTESGAVDGDLMTIIRHEPAGNHEVKCLRACIMKGYNTMTDDGKFSEPDLIRVAQVYTKGDAALNLAATEIIKACDGIPLPADHCESAEEYSKCTKTEASKRGIELDI